MLFALPMILTNVSYYFIPLVSVMFAGHLGDLELAGSNLANSWAAALVSLSWILVLLAGLMPNSEVSTSLIAMCVNTEAICYMVAYGISAAASTRVSNELGAGNPDRARRAMAVTLKLTDLLALSVVFGLSFGHNLWASIFSGSPIIIKAYASMTPLVVVSISCDFVQGILSGR
ncbi:hypothetical protein OROGR_015337 [Orobanche gracilis]